MSRSKSTWLRRIVGVAALIGLTGTGVLGWNWLDGLTCSEISVHGFRYADPDEILDVARVDTGVRLLDVDPDLIEDRVERHPWVDEARVRRLPPATVSINVRERVPVALATDERGRPAFYADASGRLMPAVPEAVFDVPLLQGVRLPENATQPIESTAVRDLLAALDGTDESTDALISSFSIDASGDVTLHTTPAADRGAITVRLGRHDFEEKLVRLGAFWEQAVISRPDLSFDLIDLRFDSQIVTRES